MVEYQYRRATTRGAGVRAREDAEVRPAKADDPLDEATLRGMLEVEANRTLHTNSAFVWDFNSMLTHVDTQLRGYDALIFEDEDPPLAPMREKVLTNLAGEAILQPFVTFRRAYEYDLACNEADRRIFMRRNPLRTVVISRTILANKRDTLVNEDTIPKTWDELFNGTDLMSYRLNTDAALYFYNMQTRDGLMEQLILRGWEAERPNELDRPYIIHVRAGNCWAVVHDGFPTVKRCTSLLAAYVVISAMLEDVPVPSDAALVPKRLRLDMDGA